VPAALERADRWNSAPLGGRHTSVYAGRSPRLEVKAQVTRAESSNALSPTVGDWLAHGCRCGEMHGVRRPWRAYNRYAQRITCPNHR